MKNQIRLGFFVLFIMLFSACATFEAQYKNNQKPTSAFPQDKQIEHSFYIIGDAGNASQGEVPIALKSLKEALKTAPKKSTTLFLGDNIYENGLPPKEHEDRALAEYRLQVQVDAVKDFEGQTIFMPGNHDWYSGLKGLKRQEKFIEDALGKNTFLPENGCPIEKVKISDDVVLLVVDTQWYITNWDKHPTMNDNCEIKTRNLFFDELKSQIKKARGKTTIIAMHNPLFSNGNHGGQYDFNSHLKPVPVLGTLKNILRKTGGVANVDDQNSQYRTFKKRLITLARENDKVVVLSGHDHNLQYIIKESIPQIVSGSGSKLTATRNVGGGVFSYAVPGYVRLDVFTDGSSYARFYNANDNSIVFETEVLKEDVKDNNTNFSSDFSKEKTATIYSKEETTKGGLYRMFWGERYRKYFSTEVKVPTVNLDTLFGGLTPVRKGGGNQSMSLRLEDEDGREYVMRALRKNALQYMQAFAFKDQYIEGQFEGTYTENLVLDMFAGSHPYAPFTVGTLADAIGVMHTNPVLYYVPKQKALGAFNAEFGDMLYMIEERAADGHGDKASFAYSNELISTYDMMNELKKDEDNVVDEAAYIKARLFDMLIGDWDRHEDQWRWAKFKEGKKTVYRPMPRDRDQAFSIMSDGVLLGVATRIVPAMRLLQGYEEELNSPKWFNLEPYPLDMALIAESNKTVWNAQVQHIVNGITDEVINEAFEFFPPEVRDETIDEIKKKLKGRRRNLQKISDTYYKHINKFAVIKGTNKDDWFEIERLPSTTKITAYRIKKGEKGEIFHQREYTYKETKEIWIYGLDDDDVFKVTGEGKNLIKIRLIGGQNKDVYNIENGKKIKIYDFKSKESVFVTNKGAKKLTDDYETNVYDHKKLKYNSNQLIPVLGANPDDGFKIGVSNTYSVFGFERNPFTSRHIIGAQYYFATDGYDLTYKGEFANVFGSWNLGVDVQFTSPNYSVNFFGFGNETNNPNVDDDNMFDMDYNRVKLRTFKINPSIHWKGMYGSKLRLGLSYEDIDVEETTGRFINTFYQANGEETHHDFLGAEANFNYRNKDNEAFPTLGMEFDFTGGYKTNLDESRGFAYIIPSLGIDYKLVPSGQLVFATKVKGHINFGNDFEFYQGASLGASDGLRGYRNQRFTGKRAFYQNTDIRLNLRKLKTSLLPLDIGIYGGFDYGRVWVSGEGSDKWNNSVGGGVFFNGANMITGNVSAFNSDDGVRFAFQLGFGF